tara:strand:+ start:348 stop:542 length:195 start_codon:yes stop_codon:yes gene_type:complete
VEPAVQFSQTVLFDAVGAVATPCPAGHVDHGEQEVAAELLSGWYWLLGQAPHVASLVADPVLVR